MMKTLYVSDLDGTLMRSCARTSDFTNRTVNRLVSGGMLFSYATARSYGTARRATQGLNVAIPLVVYNGAMIVSNTDGAFLQKNFFPAADIPSLMDALLARGVYPLVYAFVNGTEHFSYLPDRCSPGLSEFLATRRGDPRSRPVSTVSALLEGEIFYFTCIDTPEKLDPLYETYRSRYHCVYAKDFYSDHLWLEIMPETAGKASAVRQLKTMLGCDRIVAFGDGKNDLDLFALADEAYAVANAAPELKAAATGVIASNDEDGVARWLAEHFDIHQEGNDR